MENTTCGCKLKKLAKEVTKVEFELQDAWEFPRDARFHRFWDCPQCECPNLDNEDAYGTKFALYAKNCPIHGNNKNCKEK